MGFQVSSEKVYLVNFVYEIISLILFSILRLKTDNLWLIVLKVPWNVAKGININRIDKACGGVCL